MDLVNTQEKDITPELYLNLQLGDNVRTISKNIAAENATNSHPLMYSPPSLASPDFPDLIPEKAKIKYLNPSTSLLPTNDLESSFSSNASLGSSLEVISYHEAFTDAFHEPLDLVNIKIDGDRSNQIDISDNENEKSDYEAHLSSNLQNISLTMNDTHGNLNFVHPNKKSNKLRKIQVDTSQLVYNSEVSSIDSNSDSLRSEDRFCGNLNTSDDLEEDISHEPIEPLSAADERKHARHWQRTILPGGEQRTIDMRVIEPYKRVLSHGGYLRAGGHTAIVIFAACFLPDKSRKDYEYVMDNLFLYVLWTLERLVTDDYVLIYLHGGATKLPAFTWIKRCYQMVGRKLRKNLLHLYLVHPTLWIKTMLFMAKPFISSKFYRKITYASTLKELTVKVPVEHNAIPDRVKTHDSLLRRN